MTLAARCPWCETVFRLTEGQVAAKGGMARCGVCNHTFNALDALLSDSAVAALERGVQAREASNEATLRASSQASLVAPPKADEKAPAPAPLLSVPSFLWRKQKTADSVSAVTIPSPIQPASAQAAPVTPVSAPTSLQDGAQPAPQAAAQTVQKPTPTPQPAAPLPAITPLPAVPVARVAAPPAAKPSAQPSLVPVIAEVTPPPVLPSGPLQTAPARVPLPRSSAEMRPTARSPESPSAFNPGGNASDPQHGDYEIELPNFDAERAADEAMRARSAPPAPSAPPPVVVAQQLAAMKAVRSAVLRPYATNPMAPRTDLGEAGMRAPSSADLDDFAGPPTRPPQASSLGALRLSPPGATDEVPFSLAEEEERRGPSTFQPSFLQTDEPRSGVRRFFTVVGFFLCLVFLVGLVAQSVYWWRSDIAVWVPQVKPYLVLACQRIHCVIEPTAQIDQLSIESSELVAVPGSPNTLSFTTLVRNHSVTAMAFPAVEVTLTDIHDQAVLRRVFLPRDYLADPSSNRMLAGIPGNSEFSLKLTFNTSGVVTSGYRAGIFYP